jgi:hypothetical protein
VVRLLSTGGIFDEVQVHVDLGSGTKECKYKIGLHTILICGLLERLGLFRTYKDAALCPRARMLQGKKGLPRI